jgi:hypothetical protein
MVPFDTRDDDEPLNLAAYSQTTPIFILISSISYIIHISIHIIPISSTSIHINPYHHWIVFFKGNLNPEPPGCRSLARPSASVWAAQRGFGFGRGAQNGFGHVWKMIKPWISMMFRII